MYVFDICAEDIFVTFPWWLENVKSRSKIALFSNERHFEIWFPKKRTITFFGSKWSKLHKKDPIVHVATTFSLKQVETRTSHGPIPHPLKIALTLNWLVLNVRASSTRKFEMLSEKWGAHYSVNFMNNFGLLVWVPINRYYWVILGIIVKNVFKKNI